MTGIYDHLNYFDIWFSCSDSADRIETTSASTKETSSALSNSAEWMIYIALAMGWILALNFCCCYYKMRKEMKLRNSVGPNKSYYAFNDSEM